MKIIVLLFLASSALLFSQSQNDVPGYYTLSDYGVGGFAQDPFGDPVDSAWFREIPSRGFDDQNYRLEAIQLQDRDESGRALYQFYNPHHQIKTNIIVYGLNQKQQRVRKFLIQLHPGERAWFDLASEEGITGIEMESSLPFSLKGRQNNKNVELQAKDPIKPYDFEEARALLANPACTSTKQKVWGLVINALNFESVPVWFDAYPRNYTLGNDTYYDIQHLEVYYPSSNYLFHTTHVLNFDSNPNNDDSFWTGSCSIRDNAFTFTNRTDNPKMIHSWKSIYRTFHNPGVEARVDCHFEPCTSSGLYWFYVTLDSL